VLATTVASRQKILQNNSISAQKRNWLAGKNGGRTAGNFEQKRQKTGRKQYLKNIMWFLIKIDTF
jgi:uncharacterized protein YnzC (UPF0291/DUF896 family)